MIEREVVVRHKDGLHARPATQFVKLARSFSATIDVVLLGKAASAKSLTIQSITTAPRSLLPATKPRPNRIR